MKYARAKRAKILFSSVKYANLWGFCCHRRRGCFRLRLHERGFISIQFHDFKTAPKLMRFGSVYTEPFSYSLRHAEVITDQRDPSKKESTILFFSSWRNVDL